MTSRLRGHETKADWQTYGFQQSSIKERPSSHLEVLKVISGIFQNQGLLEALGICIVLAAAATRILGSFTSHEIQAVTRFEEAVRLPLEGPMIYGVWTATVGRTLQVHTQILLLIEGLTSATAVCFQHEKGRRLLARCLH